MASLESVGRWGQSAGSCMHATPAHFAWACRVCGNSPRCFNRLPSRTAVGERAAEGRTARLSTTRKGYARRSWSLLAATVGMKHFPGRLTFDMSGRRQTAKPAVDCPLDGGVSRVGALHLGARPGPTTTSPFSQRPTNITATAHLRVAPGVWRSRWPHFTALLQLTAFARQPR